MSISWGPIVNGYGRIGINVEVSDPSTNPLEAIVTIDVYFWSKYSVSDSNNGVYFDDGATSAITKVGSANINTTHDSGSGWSTSNQEGIYYNYTTRVPRTTSTQRRSCAAKLMGVDAVGGTMTHTVQYEIAPIKTYTISYNPNTSSFLPNASPSVPVPTTKYHDQLARLADQSEAPQLEGLVCTGWLLPGESTLRPFGSNISLNQDVIAYANWTVKKYKITYDPNGGTSGFVTSEEKYHTFPPNYFKGDQNVWGKWIRQYRISAPASPSRQDYDFVGWSTDPNAETAMFQILELYEGNADTTLYAVWKRSHVPPTISNVIVERCDADGNHTDEGTYFDVAFDWATDETNDALGSAVYIRVFLMDGTPVFERNFEILDLYTSKGHFSLSDHNVAALGNGEIDTDYDYTVSIMVMDNSYVTSSVERTLRSIAYPIDILAKGKGIAFGKPASEPDTMDVNFKAKFNKAMIFSAEAKQALLDIFYPVNSIYITHSNNDPNVMFGGTWERIQDRFLFGTAVGGVYSIGDEAGEAQHYLTEDEMPKHVHTDIFYQTAGDINKKLTLNGGSVGYNLGWTANAGNGTNNEFKTGYAGGGNQQVGLGEAHNNMPPFVAVAIWRRTA